MEEPKEIEGALVFDPATGALIPVRRLKSIPPSQEPSLEAKDEGFSLVAAPSQPSPWKTALTDWMGGARMVPLGEIDAGMFDMSGRLDKAWRDEFLKEVLTQGKPAAGAPDILIDDHPSHLAKWGVDGFAAKGGTDLGASLAGIIHELREEKKANASPGMIFADGPAPSGPYLAGPLMSGAAGSAETTAYGGTDFRAALDHAMAAARAESGKALRPATAMVITDGDPMVGGWAPGHGFDSALREMEEELALSKVDVGTKLGARRSAVAAVEPAPKAPTPKGK